MFTDEQFQQPNVEYGLHPFWFWNGEMREDEIERQITEMHDKGIGGFFPCARQGLTIPYLSDAWFEKVRFACQVAHKYGMHVWLYDEYPYPSGIAGGEVVLQHPDAKATTLQKTIHTVRGGEQLILDLPWARVVYAQAAPVGSDGRSNWQEATDIRDHIGNMQTEPVFQKAGLTAYNRKRYFSYGPIQQVCWQAPAGSDWQVVIMQEKEIDDFKYYGTFVDPCHQEAMQTFIRITHERYAHHLADYFGHTIKGMFTDETGLLGALPWSPHLVPYFKQVKGYDLTAHLYALVDEQADDAARIRFDYYDCVHRLLRENYHRPVHDWCEKYGLSYVAEVPSTRMTTQLHSHVPGGDSAHEKIGVSMRDIVAKRTENIRSNPKMVSSLMRQLGRKRSLIECFHSVGWSMTMQDAKWMVDRMAAMGINLFNPHAYFYTVDGMTQHDAPPSQFIQMPYWKYGRALGEYISRISYVMSEGVADIRIAVLFPISTLWTHMANPFVRFNYVGSNEEEKVRLETIKEDWRSLIIRLAQARRDVDHIDAELMHACSVENGTLSIGDARYDVLILPPMTNIEQSAWNTIQSFIEDGGTVISFGMLPQMLLEDEEWRHANQDDGQNQLDNQIGVTSTPTVSTTSSTGSTATVNNRTVDRAGDIFKTFSVPDSGAEQYWNGGQAMEIQKGKHNAYYIPFHGSCQTEEALDRLLGVLDDVSPAAVRLQTDNDAQCFLMQTRHNATNQAVVFISNQEGEQHNVQVQIDLRALFSTGYAYKAAGTAKLNSNMPTHQDSNELNTVRVQELDLETGERIPLSITYNTQAGVYTCSLDFAPYQAHLIEISVVDTEDNIAEQNSDTVSDTMHKEPNSQRRIRDNDARLSSHVAALSKVDTTGCWKLHVRAAEQWQVEARDANALRLDMFQMSVKQRANDDSETVSQDVGNVPVKTFIDQCQDLEESMHFPLHFHQQFGIPMQQEIAYPLDVTYRTKWEMETVPQSCTLLMDQSAILGDWWMVLNGHRITRSDFREQFVYDPANIVCNVEQMLQQGGNELVVHVQVEKDWHGVVDALYILGDFGVTFNKQNRAQLGAAPDTVPALTGGPHTGYPYYAGTFVFTKEVHIQTRPDMETFELVFDNWDAQFYDCAEVFVNGHSLGIRPWTPYRWVGQSEWLQEGVNTVHVHVANTLIGMLEGQYFDYKTHELHPVQHLK